jgi:arylsulfatase A
VAFASSINVLEKRLMKRILLSVLAGFAIVAPARLQASSDQPNVLLLFCDDLGYGDLACYGHPHIKTPHLDRLARQGIKLTDCYSSAPVCSSSRAGIMTGRTPNRSGVYDWIPNNHVMHLKDEEVTVASLLKAAGYDTAHSGKWHLNGKFNSVEHPQPGDHGFDHWFATQNNASPTHENPKNFVRNGKEVGPLEGFSCQLVADEGIAWLKGRKEKSRPFFLNIWFHEPHEPVASPRKMADGYKAAAENEDQAQYFANVENMDAACGRLLAALDELGVAEDTLVFFTSDNGPETLKRYRGAGRSYGSPGVLRGMKLHIYEGGIRVPGILRWPAAMKLKPGQIVNTPVSAVDLLPTLCELAGADVPNDRPIDGASFAPVFRGEAIARSTPLFWNYYRALSAPKVAMRDGDWKLVAHWDGPEKPISNNVDAKALKLIKSAKLTTFELYNLREDISEKTDLAAEQPKRVKQLADDLKRKYLEVQKEGPYWQTPVK